MDAPAEKTGRVVLQEVPWMNKSEFDAVHDNLYSVDPIDQRWAVDMTSVWRARNRIATPVGVDATAGLVKARILDYTVQHNISVDDFEDASTSYCMALLRFVNYITETGQPHDRKLPIRHIARLKGVPDWIVQLRHQVSHSSAPSLERLRLAAEISLKWLDENYWKTEIASTENYCPKRNDVADNTCQELLSAFQKHQYQVLFGVECPYRKREMKPSVKHILAEITTLARTNENTLVETLARPEFLLSQTACSKPLVECSDIFITKEAVALPKNIEKFWQPVISILARRNLTEKLVITLLESHNTLNDENQRMAISWIWKILEAHAESRCSLETKQSHLFKAVQQNRGDVNNSLKWFHIMDVCLHSLSKYIPAVLPIITEHVFPPIPETKKNSLMGLVAIATGALVDFHSGNDKSTVPQRIYDIEDVKTLLELKEVVDKGETSLYETDNPWKLCTDDIKWADYPLGTIFTSKGDVLSPNALNLCEFSEIKAEVETPEVNGEAVVPMECDVSQTLTESVEVPSDQEKINKNTEVEVDESYISEGNAHYFDIEDVVQF